MPTKTVLLVDDNPIDLMINNKTIERYNGEIGVVKAMGAKEALTMLTNGDCKPTCLLLDIKMPGMDGFEFLEALKDSGLKVEFGIHMLSSSIDPADLENAEANPLVNSYIEKPLNIDKLKEIDL